MLSSLASHLLPPKETRSLAAAKGHWSGWEKMMGEASLGGQSKLAGHSADTIKPDGDRTDSELALQPLPAQAVKPSAEVGDEPVPTPSSSGLVSLSALSMVLDGSLISLLPPDSAPALIFGMFPVLTGLSSSLCPAGVQLH
ncbi:hypothetical protein Q8A67_018754 [Cirrhinus molitorella]|uniref:Uncharacterized protein n=1 Tax=Cirrhinus molitorella TaxID=172907 RepID=A0AA88TF21_9TELE|nr:hypothetical protein Q8A67_018754 [Cirrhinus molitorella]